MNLVNPITIKVKKIKLNIMYKSMNYKYILWFFLIYGFATVTCSKLLSQDKLSYDSKKVLKEILTDNENYDNVNFRSDIIPGIPPDSHFGVYGNSNLAESGSLTNYDITISKNKNLNNVILDRKFRCKSDVKYPEDISCLVLRKIDANKYEFMASDRHYMAIDKERKTVYYPKNWGKKFVDSEITEILFLVKINYDNAGFPIKVDKIIQPILIRTSNNQFTIQIEKRNLSRAEIVNNTVNMTEEIKIDTTKGSTTKRIIAEYPLKEVRYIIDINVTTGDTIVNVRQKMYPVRTQAYSQSNMFKVNNPNDTLNGEIFLDSFLALLKEKITEPPFEANSVDESSINTTRLIYRRHKKKSHILSKSNNVKFSPFHECVSYILEYNYTESQMDFEFTLVLTTATGTDENCEEPDWDEVEMYKEKINELVKEVLSITCEKVKGTLNYDSICLCYN